MSGAFCSLIEIGPSHATDRTRTELLHTGAVEHGGTAGRFIEGHEVLELCHHGTCSMCAKGSVAVYLSLGRARM